MVGVTAPAALFGLLTFSVSAVSRFRSNVNSAGKSFDYDYAHHGADWLQGLCSDHERQSPVDFPTLDDEPNGEMVYTYQVVKSSFEFLNNGLTYSADFAGLGYGGITYENNWYNLLNVNFHSLSEHTFAGRHYPLEMHFVHKRWDTDDMVIVAVPLSSHNCTTSTGIPTMCHHDSHPFSETLQTHMHRNVLIAPTHSADHDKMQSTQDPKYDKMASMIQKRAERVDPNGLTAAKPKPWNTLTAYRAPAPTEEFFNTQLQHFLKAPLPIINTKSIAIVNELDPLDLNHFMEGGVFFEYAGSLTAPPCATNVQWFVRRNPILASESQIQLMSDRIFDFTADFGNYRETMPINGRPIATRIGVESASPPQPEVPSVPYDTLKKPASREQQAVIWAKDALKMSKVASDYVYSMDKRLQRAARAHADALAPDLGVAPATPAPIVQPKEISPVDMAKTAAVMAKAIAASAKEAIRVSSDAIATEAEAAGVQAAKEAAIMAGKEIVIPTAEPPPGAPGGAPLAAPGPGPGPAMPPAPAPEGEAFF